MCFLSHKSMMFALGQGFSLTRWKCFFFSIDLDAGCWFLLGVVAFFCLEFVKTFVRTYGGVFVQTL